jgi:outer membrane lipoprotein-sorting protein
MNLQKDKVKKAVLLLMFILLVVVLAGCTKATDPNGIERNASYGLVEVKTILNNIVDGNVVVCYDPKTMVCYLKICDSYRMGLSPYYVIGEDGKPEIAVYGVNYN